MQKLRAVVYTAYGGPDVLHKALDEKPYPKADEVLIKVRAVSVNFGDLIAGNFKNIILCSKRLYSDILSNR